MFTVGEDAEVADANQAFGQNVKKKSAQELMGGNGHDLLFAAVSIVSPTERDATVPEGHEPAVGDGDAMGVASQIVENVFGAAEGRLGSDSAATPACVRFTPQCGVGPLCQIQSLLWKPGSIFRHFHAQVYRGAGLYCWPVDEMKSLLL